MKNKQGFTLLEIMIALAIIAIVGSSILSSLKGPRPRYEREQFIARLNALMQFAWQQSIATGMVHKIVFNMSDRLISVEQQAGIIDGKPTFKPLKKNRDRAQLAIAQQLQFKNFIIEGFDEMGRFSGQSTGKTWFFVVPDGLTQEVTITIADTKDTVRGQARHIELVLNPFSAQFEVYDNVQ